MKEKEVLKSILGGFFKHYIYLEAVKKFRLELKEKPYYYESWEKVKSLIQDRKLEENEPLKLMNIDANLPLDENSNKEAYYWLELMIRNIEETEEDKIVPY